VRAPTANEALALAKECVRLAGSAVSRHEWSATPMHLLLCRLCHTASVTFRRRSTDLE